VAGDAWDAFGRSAELIAAGERAAGAALPCILPWLQQRASPVLAYSQRAAVSYQPSAADARRCRAHLTWHLTPGT
jgi:hypothetical protein